MSLSIRNLIKDKVYLNFIPLHDGSYEHDTTIDVERLIETSFYGEPRYKTSDDDRKLILASTSDNDNDDGHYTTWSAISSIAGILVVINGTIEGIRTDAIKRAFNGDLAKISVIWDNSLTAPFALFMSIWSVMFLQFWKRTNSSIQYDWGITEFAKEIYKNVAWWLTNFENHKTPTQFEGKYRRSGKKNTEIPQWIYDDRLSPNTGTIVEYEEMVIQFGFIALFGSAFPLAPLFAWLNNIVEIRADAFKFIVELQRTFEEILNILAFMAVLTNTIIIAFHSTWMKQQLQQIISDPNNKYELMIARLAFIMAFAV
ncbi:calcium-activated chloride channel-domain-containing protein [Gigaspora rosea]|uniref:Calcium-activated chloride channel-domain-containing protein n=1 Tax=Gigaspora rosea TaxID=44941 RepID=A0A397WAK4_9GLOM|nr:calcium-activated chloride channel-domain-containing protein [Gigaspora rosea]